jgi:membrane-associated protease RseP (regulator of RpoE activity)
VAGGPGPIPGAPANELEKLKGLVAQYFPVYETRITAYSLVLLVHADPSTLEGQFDRLRQELWPLFYVPQIRREGGEYVVEVVRRPPLSPYGGAVNLALLIATIVSTVFAGAFLWVAYRGGATLLPGDLLWGGIYFAAPLMAILGLHELAHYAMARYHRVDASLPYFLPVPPPFLIFGTFGAFISLREPFPDKKALLDIGAAGPIAGFAVAIPVTLLGLHLSALTAAPSPIACGPTFVGIGYGNLLLGTPLIWQLFTLFVPGSMLNLHPLAIAGWVGILVTAFNLLPAGQLDGGHVARALLGKYSVYASWAVIAALLVLGVEAYVGWLIFAVFIFLVGLRHPPPLNDISPVGAKRIAVGVLAVAILVSGFTLVPLAAPTGAFHLQGEATAPAAAPAGAVWANNQSVTGVNGDQVGHAYIVSGAIAAVNLTGANGSGPGATGRLTGANLTAFEANASWQILAPNGNVTTFDHRGSFTLPHAEYGFVAAGGSGDWAVIFGDSQLATVSLVITVTQLCPTPTVANSDVWRTDVYPAG